MNAEERGVGSVQVFQDKDQHDHSSDDGDRNKRPRDGSPSRWYATLKASGSAIRWLWDLFECFAALIWCAHKIKILCSFIRGVPNFVAFQTSKQPEEGLLLPLCKPHYGLPGVPTPFRVCE